MLKVVSHYDFSVLFMSGMGFQKAKSLDGGGGEWSALSSFILDFFSNKAPYDDVFNVVPPTFVRAYAMMKCMNVKSKTKAISSDINQ